ncbi:MAG: hypothetical protein E7261_13145 [Lachnospiraceae bacterium]|nr:hypothetical protein [Lachnospiraceae bacterium]
MATSSIFAHVEINDVKKAEQFVMALEESERAQEKKQRTAPVISVMKDTNDIQRLLAKRVSTK